MAVFMVAPSSSISPLGLMFVLVLAVVSVGGGSLVSWGLGSWRTVQWRRLVVWTVVAFLFMGGAAFAQVCCQNCDPFWIQCCFICV